MKNFFTLILAIILLATLFTACSKDDNSVSINITIKEFYTPEERQEYAETLDTTKYYILGEQFRTHYKSRSTYNLILMKKANNETYEVFQFSSKDTRKEFREKIDSNKKVSYYEVNGFYYLIVISENVAKKSTVTVKDILQNEENYIVIADDNSLVMIPKNISEFVNSDYSNTVYLETTAGTITKATFCITEEMQEKIP